jgi:hypothetical protein
MKRTVFRAFESAIVTLWGFRQICEHRKHLFLQAVRIHTCTYRLTKGRVRYTSLVGRYITQYWSVTFWDCNINNKVTQKLQRYGYIRRWFHMWHKKRALYMRVWTLLTIVYIWQFGICKNRSICVWWFMVTLWNIVVTFLTRANYISGNYTMQSHPCNISNIDLHNVTIRMIRCNIPDAGPTIMYHNYPRHAYDEGFWSELQH